MASSLPVIAAVALTAVPAIAADSYVIDATHSIPVFEFSHLGMTTQTGRFDKVKGTVVLDPAARKGSVTYEIQTDSLNMGFGTEKPDSAGYQLFMVTSYPKIVFKSNHLIFDNNNAVIAADGKITLLGVTKPLRVAFEGFKCSLHPLNRKAMCAGNASATIKRSAFGMVRYLPAISDEIRISIPVEAYKN